MPVPSSLNDLSTTPALNSPAGSESPSTLDDYIRAHAAFIKQVSDAEVTLTGDQTIAGNKTFSGNLSYTGTLTGGTGVINIGSGQIYKDTAGNVGIGVTPSAWSASGVLELSSGAVVGTANSAEFGTNYYFSAGFKYKTTSYASRYAQTNGTHAWYNAPSGTAGNPITFTQAMTLDASGNLLVGTNDASGGNTTGFEFYYGAGSSRGYIGHITGTSSGTNYLQFNINGVGIGSITQNGSTAVAYNTTSDHRLKENVRPADAKRFMDIEFVDFEWIDGRHDCGVIAHQLQSVYPDLVLGDKDATDADGNPVYQQVNYTGLIGRIGARVQQLQRTVDSQAAIIEQLTARISALEAK